MNSEYSLNLGECINSEEECNIEDGLKSPQSFTFDTNSIPLSSRCLFILYRFATSLMSLRSPSQCLSIALNYIRSSLELPAVEIVLSDTERDVMRDCYSTNLNETQNHQEAQFRSPKSPNLSPKTWISYTINDKGESKRKFYQFPSGVFNLSLRRQLMVYVPDVETDPRVNITSDLHFESFFPGKSMLLVPIKLNSQIQIGLLVLYLSQLTYENLFNNLNLDSSELPKDSNQGAKEPQPGRVDAATEANGTGPQNSFSASKEFSVLFPTSPIDVSDDLKWLFKIANEFSYTLGKSLDYSHEWRELLSTRERADGLLAIMQSLYADRLGIQSSVVALTTHAKKLIRVESCTVYIVDKVHQQLWSISSDDGSQVFKPLHSCLAGRCALTGRIISSHNIESDKFNKNQDSERHDDRTINEASDSSDYNLERDIIHVVEKVNNDAVEPPDNESVEVVCMPIMSKDGSNVLAVIEAINKKDPELGIESFSPEDIHLLEIFARIVGPQLELSDFASGSSIETEAGLAFKINPNLQSKIPRRVPPEDCILEEEEDES